MSLTLKTPPPERSVAVHGRIQQLDGLRAVAILGVFFNHTLHIPLTWVGVDIFFVLSGFLITGILLERKIESRTTGGYFHYFYSRRAFRILPPYVLTILIYGLFFTWNAFHPWWLFAFFGMNLQDFFWHGWVKAPLPLWSLAVEEQFYLVWPVIILLVSEKLLLRLAIAALVITPFLRVFCTPMFSTHFYIYTLTPFRADLLCAGAVLAMLWKRRTPRTEQIIRTRAWMGVVAGFGGLMFVQIWPSLRLASNTRASNGLDYSLSVLGSFSLVAWTLADRGWLKGLLSTRPMRFIGQISYTMYLTHIIAIFVTERYVHSTFGITTIALAVTILYSWLSWIVMERPLIGFAAKKVPRRTHLPTPATTG
jgi:peptidoglycan/LPS O-acetylase OafA/YrhL